MAGEKKIQVELCFFLKVTFNEHDPILQKSRPFLQVTVHLKILIYQAHVFRTLLSPTKWQGPTECATLIIPAEMLRGLARKLGRVISSVL